MSGSCGDIKMSRLSFFEIERRENLVQRLNDFRLLLKHCLKLGLHSPTKINQTDV